MVVVCLEMDRTVFSHSSVHPWQHIWLCVMYAWLDRTNSLYCGTNLYQLCRKWFLFASWHQCRTWRRLHCHFTEPYGYVDWCFVWKWWECHLTIAMEEACSGWTKNCWCWFTTSFWLTLPVLWRVLYMQRCTRDPVLCSVVLLDVEISEAINNSLV